MKLSVVFLFLALQVSATNYGQQVLNLKEKNISLADVFHEIEKQSDFKFYFSDDLVSVFKFDSVNIVNASIHEVMERVLEHTDLNWKPFKKNKIVIIEETTLGRERLAFDFPVKGIVTDESGRALEGVSISIKGTKRGAVTKSDGSFALDVPENAVLIISSTGYKTQEIFANESPDLYIKLKREEKVGDEVIVVGYGTRKKSDLTGAVASLSSDQLKDKPIANFAQAMTSQMSGVQIQQVNGAPGGEGLAIRVRGTGSITQSNSPLYVVDGYPMEKGALSLVSPSDIETIQVLKDASSTAIYGSRGANGVVMITTKKGKSGAPVVGVSSYAGFQERTRAIPVMNRDQYIDWFIDGRNQAWLDQAVINADPNKNPHTISDPNSRRRLYPSANSLFVIPDGQSGFRYDFQDPASVASMPDNNWQDLLFRRAPMQQHELSVSGGSEKTRYAFSGSYLNQQGISLNTDYKRFNFRNSIESQVSDRIKVGLNLNAYSANGQEQANGKDAPILYSLLLPPIFDLKNPDGSYGSMVRNPEILAGDVANAIGIAELVDRRRRKYGWLGVLYGEMALLDQLKYRININGGIIDERYETFEPSIVDFDGSKAPRPAKGINERNTDYDWVVEQTLTYENNFADKHNVVFMGGFTSQKHANEYMYGEARGFPNDNIKTLNAGTMYALSNTKSEYSMLSYYGRANYTFDQKYLLTATLRGDGSSRFGANRKWGIFPSVSAAWRISQERFMQSIEVINDLKLRMSYGVSGNNRIGNYSAIGLLNTGFYPTGDALQNIVSPSTIPNPELGWERVLQSNIGLDLGLLNNRIRLEADVYRSKSIDLLLNVPVPTITGYSSQIQNIGKVQNEGLEFLVSTKNLTGAFRWSTDLNFTFNRNKVLEVGPGGQPIFAGAPNANNSFITLPGYPIASFYGYVYEGVFMSQEELDKYPHLPGDKIGDGRYKDVNGDGKLNQNDKDIIGNNQPKFFGGLGNNFSYKHFSLSTQLGFSYGAKLFSFYKRMAGIYHGDRNAIIEQVNRWRSPEEPGDGIHFRATRNPTGWQRDPSSAWVTDGSFLRLRDITLAYTFGLIKWNTVKVKGLRVYASAQNLFTWTKYPGFDPENSSQGDGLSRGGDYLGYPAARSVIVGLNVTL